jgi:hypothetical protein
MLSKTTILLPLTLTFASAIGCAQPQTPYSFAAKSDSRSAADAAARTLAAEGWDVGKVDRESGIVTSKWIAYPQAMNDGVLVHRLTVTLSPSGAGSSVLLRMDVKKCPPGGYTVGDVEVQGTCQPIDGIFPNDQSAIDSVGAKLQAALASDAKAAPAP